MTQALPLDPRALVAVDPGKVARALEHLPDLDESARLAQLFKLLGDPNRTRILHALLGSGELCVSDLAAVVDAPETTVSQALRLLRTAGVVANRRAGRLVYYRLADAHVRMLLELSLEHTRHDGTR